MHNTYPAGRALQINRSCIRWKNLTALLPWLFATVSSDKKCSTWKYFWNLSLRAFWSQVKLERQWWGKQFVLLADTLPWGHYTLLPSAQFYYFLLNTGASQLWGHSLLYFCSALLLFSSVLVTLYGLGTNVTRDQSSLLEYWQSAPLCAVACIPVTRASNVMGRRLDLIL